eukprot:6191220-Prorocentrum_lima.AAC.1
MQPSRVVGSGEQPMEGWPPEGLPEGDRGNFHGLLLSAAVFGRWLMGEWRVGDGKSASSDGLTKPVVCFKDLSG